MFENLKAAKAVRLTLSNLQGPDSSDKDMNWSCDVLFYSAKIGSAHGQKGLMNIKVDINDGLQEQITGLLKGQDFKISAAGLAQVIDLDQPKNFMALAIEQIADELDLAKQLAAQAHNQTLVLLHSSPESAIVFSEPYSPSVKQRLQEQYGEDLLCVINESLVGIFPM